MREKSFKALGASTRKDPPEGGSDPSSISVEECSSPTRRSLLKVALFLPAASVLGYCALDPIHAETQKTDATPTFLTAEERAFVEAATERLIPDQDDSPGAKGAAVAVFIDIQLAGSYGRAEHWYMHGPWAEGTSQQGYQLKLSPGALYQTAIRDVDTWCQKNHGHPFTLLSGAEQDDVLHGLESGVIELADVPAKEFFTMLWNNTVEGFLADPMYGGNRNFAGWKLVGFPGPRYNYVDEIEQYGKPYTQPTVGLLGRDGTLLRSG